VTWWGNIRFETAFTPDVCRLLAASGLIAVTGGLEVASDKMLKKMDKGITLAQTVQVTKAFAEAGISTHAYLMYGFPNQTAVDTMNAMEFVRQMFQNGLIESAFWHRFVLTRHSLVYKNPEKFGIEILPTDSGVFASNDVAHTDNEQHDQFDDGLPLALASWLRGSGLERDVSEWFEQETPAPTIDREFVAQKLEVDWTEKQTGTLVWIGSGVLQGDRSVRMFGSFGEVEVYGSDDELEWLLEVVSAATPESNLSLEDVIEAFPDNWDRWSSKNWDSCRWAGLIII
jgi:hypothetical protein